MKKAILLILAITLLSCQHDFDIDPIPEPTPEEICNCYKGIYFVAGNNIGSIAQGKKEFYSNNCNDDGIRFKDDSLLWTMKLMIKCN
jgi:hypothetical protein